VLLGCSRAGESVHRECLFGLGFSMMDGEGLGRYSVFMPWEQHTPHNASVLGWPLAGLSTAILG
jgi:hypothetical protein